MKKKFYHFCGVLFILAGLFGGLQVGGWTLCLSPIIEACKAFDMGKLNGTILFITIVKCLFSGAVGGTITWIGMIIGRVLLTD